MDLVSVVIPTRGRPGALRAAIESVLGQSYPAVEMLVCEDGGTAGVSATVQTYGSVRYIDVPRCGRPGCVRNHGIRAARGELIAFLDDDDCWERDKVARQVALLAASPRAGMAWSNARIQHADGSLSPAVLGPQAPAPLYDALLAGCFIHPSTVMVRRAALEEAGAFDEELPICEDWDLWLRLARVTEAVYVPDPLTRVRRHAGSHSDRNALTYPVAARVLERQLRTGLSLRQRLRCHRTIAAMHATAAARALTAGDRPLAERHARAALRHAPQVPRNWLLLWRAGAVLSAR